MGPVRVFKGQATDVGLFSGKEKLRVQYGEGIKKFAFAVLAAQVDSNDYDCVYDIKYKKWVLLDNNVVEVSSLAARLNQPKDHIIAIVRQNGIGGLKQLINKELREYRTTEESKNEEKFKEKILVTDLGNKNGYELVQTELPQADASKIEDLPIRIKFNVRDRENVYAIQTNGYVYFEEQPITNTQVPYSPDAGKTWYLLNINSLKHRTFLEAENITLAAENDPTGGQLKKLINDRVLSLLTSKPTKSLEEAKRTEYFGKATNIESTQDKDRLILSPDTNRFVVACFKEENINKKDENIKWVKLNNEAYVDISSLSKQFNMSKNEIRSLAAADTKNGTQSLEDEIQKHINDYLAINEFLHKKYISNTDINLLKNINNPKILEISDPFVTQCDNLFQERIPVSTSKERLKNYTVDFSNKIFAFDETFLHELPPLKDITVHEVTVDKRMKYIKEHLAGKSSVLLEDIKVHEKKFFPLLIKDLKESKVYQNDKNFKRRVTSIIEELEGLHQVISVSVSKINDILEDLDELLIEYKVIKNEVKLNKNIHVDISDLSKKSNMSKIEIRSSAAADTKDVTQSIEDEIQHGLPLLKVVGIVNKIEYIKECLVGNVNVLRDNIKVHGEKKFSLLSDDLRGLTIYQENASFKRDVDYIIDQLQEQPTVISVFNFNFILEELDELLEEYKVIKK